jgi:osmotically-inducible protein OsmY
MEHRGPFGSRYEDEDERRRDFERGWEGRRYRGEAYSGGYYGGGRSDWREPHDRDTRDRGWEREGGGWGRREREHGRDERNFMDRVTDEVRSWFGDEEAERRRRQDFRDMYGREGRDERDAWDRGRSWPGERGPGRVDRSDFLGHDRDTEGPRVDRGRATGSGEWAGSPRGPYTGRGPRGYQRSDDRIREDVCERFSQHGMLDATDVDVTVVGGEVTLRGSVPSRWAKREAEDLTESVSGVRDVHNELRVSQPGAPTSGASHAVPNQPGSTTPPGAPQPGFGRAGHEGEQRGRVA